MKNDKINLQGSFCTHHAMQFFADSSSTPTTTIRSATTAPQTSTTSQSTATASPPRQTSSSTTPSTTSELETTRTSPSTVTMSASLVTTNLLMRHSPTSTDNGFTSGRFQPLMHKFVNNGSLVFYYSIVNF